MTTNTPALDLVSDFLREIELLKKKLQAAEGKALAAARAQAQAEREALKAAESAQIYRDETDASIATAADQLRQAAAIGMGVWALGNWAIAQARRKDFAARMLHREDSYVKIISDLVQGKSDAGMRDAKIALQTYKGNSEALHLARWEALMLHVGDVSRAKMNRAEAILMERE